MTVEGIEGSGKSSLLSSLVAEFRARGRAVVATREPGGTPLGDRLRAIFKEPDLAIDPLAETFVVCAARAQHVHDVIEPALAAGTSVICDRYVLATLAYQGFGRGLPLALLRTLSDAATAGRSPDLTFVLDVPVEVSLARVRARAEREGTAIDRVEREDAIFHARVRDGYLALAAQAPSRIVVIDGTQSPEAVLREALSMLDRSGVEA